ncbi:MAG: DUF5357 domain-containing protein [Spirulinaceae cyanobacterium RM2_2_10]|nr:DUF5357 domain-containing protein [Spirulinaceae cyanobacterium SM2_1_0]NJO20605.1 DUF5357 domain-containing protein [Spirulinaceae cyanobacterium RM2_2_10]
MLELLKIAFQFLRQAWNFFFPQRYYCWQMFVWLKLLSVVMALLATGPTERFIDAVGYAFLIFGLTWAGAENHFSFTPWLTSAGILDLLADFLTVVNPSVWLVTWLPLAAVIASLPKFFNKNLEFHLPDAQKRQDFLILFGSQALMACWLQFALVINNWLDRYPSLLADDFGHSLVVVRLTSLQSENQSVTRGNVILVELRPLLVKQLSNQRWSVLQPALEGNTWGEVALPDLYDQTISRLVVNPREDLPENRLWGLRAESQPTEQGYRLVITAEWQGPRSRQLDDEAEPDPYTAIMICQVEPRPIPGNLGVLGTIATCTIATERQELSRAPAL